jgi:hypothetical protein
MQWLKAQRPQARLLKPWLTIIANSNTNLSNHNHNF